MKKWWVWIPALLLSSCSHKGGDAGLSVAVSIEPQRYILEQIAGAGNLDIVTMMEPGANPETYEPTVARRAAADRSQVYFATGTLPFEQGIRRSLGDETRVVDTSEGLSLLYGTHSHPAGSSHHHHAQAPDPHTWTSVANVRSMARTMTRELSALRPDSATVYEQRLATFCVTLDSMDREIRRLAPAGTAFAIWHPSLSYLAREYGWHQIAVGQESKDFSARALAEKIDMARHASGDSLRVFFHQREFDPRHAQALNAEIGARTVSIDPQAYDWKNQIMKIADELSR